jgi:hypothetical protein
VDDSDKLPKVTCFNCVEWGHFSTNCKVPRLCFICQTTAHVGTDCSEWKKPLEPVLYMGSAAQGLGFFHVEVVEEENRAGFLKFLDNCAVLTIKEGDIEQAEIVARNGIGSLGSLRNTHTWSDFLHTSKSPPLLSLRPPTSS